jgi:5'-3' exonuclease
VSERFYVVHLIDGTYELFRHFYGLRRFTKGKDRPYGAVVGVLQTVLQMIDDVKGSASRGHRMEGLASSGQGATYLGVATDHVIESFRNRLWVDYKTGTGIERALLAQFHPLEEALAAMGVVVWPMIELEADDALASAAHIASKDKKVQKVAIWTPDKDLAQCVRDTRVVQIDGRRKIIRDAAAIREKFGVDPPLIPDLLALVGDAADGYPGISGIGAKTAAQLLNCHGPIEKFPPDVLGKQRDLALLFKKLATLRTDAPLFKRVETLRWRGPTPAFAKWAKRMKAPRLLERCEKAAEKLRAVS